MKAIKSSVLVLLIVLVIALTSCTFTSEDKNAGELYRTGTKGVTLQFLDMKTQYREGEMMGLQLLVQNRGAFDFPQGKITLSGFDKNIIHVAEEPLEIPPLEGKDAYSPDGYGDIVSVQETSPVTLTVTDIYTPTLQANLCYQYQTIATPTVCIVYNPEDMNLCIPETIKLGSQGAPVAVKQINTELMKDQIRFVAVIENEGSGIVVNPYDAQAHLSCPYQLSREQINTVLVKMEINGLDEPSCTPTTNVVKLNEGIGIISCTFTLRNQRTYTTPLKIKLDYEYMESVSTTAEIRVPYGSLPQKSSGERQASLTTTASTPNRDGCYCSEANLKKWGGCVCLNVDGRNYLCNEGQTEIKTNKNAGETINYQVKGYNVIACGDRANPSTSCPFTSQTTVPKKLSIYGKTPDGRTVSERCDLKAR